VPIGTHKNAQQRAADDVAKVTGVSGRNVGRIKRVVESDYDDVKTDLKNGKRSPNGAEQEVIHRDRLRDDRRGHKEAKHWDVKSTASRKRKIKAAKDQPRVRAVQMALNTAATGVWGIEIIEECDLDEVSIDYAIEMYDDLVNLMVALETQAAALSARLGDEKTRNTIAQLRETAGRTKAEIATGRRLADKLEKKLSQRQLGR
jgi:hypothetical protein